MPDSETKATLDVIVTTLTGTNRVVVRFYNPRGRSEPWIKEGKAVIAYNLGNLLRRLVLPLAIQSWSLTSLHQRLFKTGGRLVRHARHCVQQLAESHLTQRLFGQILGRIERLAWRPT